MTATAQTSVEAGIGVTFVSSLMASGSVTDASLLRTATMEASVTGTATVTGATLDVAQVDPNFANVSLLPHGNGTNGSTTFTDNSNNALTVTGFGNAQIDTTIKQFGTGSIEFDGNGDYLQISDSELFNVGSGNFTLEFWTYPNALTRQFLFYQGNSGGGNFSISIGIEITASNKWRGFVCSGEIGLYDINSTSNESTGVFTHIALVRNGNTLTLYVGGSSVGTSNLTGVTVNNSSSPIFIGIRNTSLPYNGFIDELRFTKGVARYTANFTPPAVQFPDQ
jgi:hypothetical protein